MKEIKDILDKIQQEVEKKRVQIQQEFETKKHELEQKYQSMLQQEKKQLEIKSLQDLELAKKKVYTEKFIEYNKQVEKIKNDLYKSLIEKLKQELFNLDKTEYYNLIKSILIKNVFPNEVNRVTFDDTNKLSKIEQQRLLNEVELEIKKKYQYTKLDLDKDDKEKLDFGIKISVGQKSKRFTIDVLIEILKPYAEEEINKLLTNI